MKIIDKYILILLLPLSACNGSKNLNMHKHNQFFVKNNKTEVINLPLCSKKIYDLNLAIQDITGIPASVQQLFYNGKELNSNSYLSDYNLTNGCFINFSCKLLGGGFDFTDFKKDPTFKVLNKNNPPNRGLSLEANCQHCGKWIWIPKGIGVFDIADEICDNKCPNCDVKIWPKQIKNACMFFCSYEVVGRDDYGKRNKIERYIYDSHGFHYQSGNLATWLTLTITTSDVSFYSGISKGLNIQARCQNCEKYIWIQKGIGKFNLSEEIKNNKCPNCHGIIWAKNFTIIVISQCEYQISGNDGCEDFNYGGKSSGNDSFFRLEIKSIWVIRTMKICTKQI